MTLGSATDRWSDFRSRRRRNSPAPNPHRYWRTEARRWKGEAARRRTTPSEARSENRQPRCGRHRQHRSRDVLERLLSEVNELRLNPPPHMLVGRAGNAHAAGFRNALQAGGDVDAVAKDILALDKHVAEMNADSVEDTLRLEGAFVASRHLPLHRQGAFDRRDDGREFDEHPVAHRLEQPSAMRGDDRLY